MGIEEAIEINRVGQTMVCLPHRLQMQAYAT